MEYPLTLQLRTLFQAVTCLNPCSNGIPSDEKQARSALIVAES